MDAKTYAAAVALIMVGVGVGYVLMGPFPETTEAQEDGGGGKYDPPHSSQVSFLNYNSTSGKQYLSFWKEGNRVTSDCISENKHVIFYDYDMNVIAEYSMDGGAEGTVGGNSTNKCTSGDYAWIDTELPQEPVRVAFNSYYGFRTF
uniref:Uncharacterized protein n=1 Tax=uncultured marine group II/III euryarchaeote SAT1000_17_E06 TaxID=1456561 RepID=A0A075IA69_9EURY|nr:hypothetical protein [uncultured marine group II/III euryarchaeote SAT1000_17_E06]